MRARHVVPALLAVVALTAASCGEAGEDAEGSGDRATTNTSQDSADGADDTMDEPADKSDPDDAGGMDDAEGGASDNSDDEADDSAGDSGADIATPALLDFTATTVRGESFDGTTLAGKPTVLWFWAPWCPVCAGQASSVAALAESHAGELNVIGVAGLDEQAAMEGFIANNGVDGVTHLSDEEGSVWRRFEVTEQSSFVVLDAEGEERYRQGYRESDELSDQVDELLSSDG